MTEFKKLIDKLELLHCLNESEYTVLLSNISPELSAYAVERASAVKKSIYGNKVFIRGLIEAGNICRNDCLYCGIRKSNKNCERYRLTEEEILLCCKEGYNLGFRTFVIQSGEGCYNTDTICSFVKKIKKLYPDCAVTLSLGEYEKDDYKRMYEAGADRYLLRHETADEEHYKLLHPNNMSFSHRMECLKNLEEIGFQTGCGFMVGSPFQTDECLAKDLKFIEIFSPDMCGIGPFIPHKDTPFGDKEQGSLEKTLFLLSLIRLIKPNILLPATTALGTVSFDGRERGLLCGANVVMPNLSPVGVRSKYTLYDNKICTGEESAKCIECLKKRVNTVGHEIVCDRGDIKRGNF